MRCKTVVILPTYNEAENLRVLLPRLRQYDVDVLVVDDSPNGDTTEVARALGCNVLRRDGKRGRVAAILAGIAATTHESIITMDADLQHPSETIPRILEALNRSEVVIASRNVAGGGYMGFSLERRIVSHVAKLLALPLAPKLRDRSSGFVAFRRSVLNGTKLPLGFSTLALSILLMGSYSTFEEVPFIFSVRGSGKSKLTVRRMLDHLVQLARLYLYKFRILRFMLVGGLGTLVGLGVLYTLTEVLSLYYLVSYIIAFVVSTTSNYVWNSLWTFKQDIRVQEWKKYVAVCATTLLLNVVLMVALTDLIGLWYMLSATIVVLVVFTLNYTFSKKLVWRQNREAK